MIEKLDLIDKKILYYLELDSRQTISKLAKELKISRSVALYRINRLKEKGIIKSYIAEINSPKIGYILFRIYLNFSNASKSQQEEFISDFTKRKNLFGITRVLGKWDISLSLIVENLYELENFKKELLLNYNSMIGNYEISILSELEYFPKDFLISEKRINLKGTKIGLDSNPLSLEEIDKKILLELGNNSNLSLLYLANKMKISLNTLKKRIKKLEREKIILAYRIFIDTEKLGYDYYKVHFNFKNYNKKDLDSFKLWLASKPFVLYFDHWINGADLEVEAVFRSDPEYVLFLNEIYNQFGRIIKNHFLTKYYSMESLKFLPEK
ncbi:MAG: Lrp/AsnC family transcriptional regulator [Candidatus Nanoarchaeia archaeon]